MENLEVLVKRFKTVDNDDHQEKIQILKEIAIFYLKQKDFHSASAIYNYLINYYLHYKFQNFEKEIDLLNRELDLIEKEFISYLGKKVPDNINDKRFYFKEKFITLEETIDIKSKEEERKKISFDFENLSLKMRNIIIEMIELAINLMEEPPCKYAFIGLGSLARDEMTPYSDLEFAILIEDDRIEIRKYFENLTQLFHLYVINLGKTILPALGISAFNDYYHQFDGGNWFYDEITPRGFSFDGNMLHACKTPLGRREVVINGINYKAFSLIQTPEELANLINKDYDDNLHLHSTLSTTIIIYGDSQLYEKYQKEINKNINKERIIKDLIEIVNRFNPGLGQELMEGKSYEIKKDFYRLPSMLIELLSAYYLPISSNLSTYKRLNELFEKKIINSSFLQNLTLAVSIAMEIRLRKYLNNRAQKDRVNVLRQNEEDYDTSLEEVAIFFDIDNIEIIYQYYYIMIPLYEHLDNCLNKTQPIKLEISNIDCYDNNLITKALIEARFMYYKKATQSLEEAVRISDNLNVFLKCGIAYQTLGYNGQAQISYEYGIRKQKEIFDILGEYISFNDQMMFLELHLRNLDAKEQNFELMSNLLFDVNCIENFITQINLQNHFLLEEFYLIKSRIFLQNHQYEKALENGEKAFQHRNKRLNENSLESYVILHYLGDLYREKGDLSKAEENFKKVFTFYSVHYEIQHLRMAYIHFSKAKLYFAQAKDNINLYEKSLKNLQRADIIIGRILGANHNRRMDILFEIANVYEQKGEYLTQRSFLSKIKYTLNNVKMCRLKIAYARSFLYENNFEQAYQEFQQISELLKEPRFYNCNITSEKIEVITSIEFLLHIIENKT